MSPSEIQPAAERAPASSLGRLRREVRETLDQLRRELIADRGVADHWTGTLSPSALSTATAISALALVHRESPDPDSDLRSLVRDGVRWCLDAQNDDGGYGDTDRSHSNIATTMLVIAALKISHPMHDEETRARVDAAARRAERWVERAGGVDALRRRYGKDKTFVIPILTNCALAGMVPWSQVQPLPFELAAVPQAMYRFLRLPVVSYAVPALVAIGQARFFHRPPRNPIARTIRRTAVSPTMAVLRRMQPDSGGYLEATPLTSFVLMSLASTRRATHPVAIDAVRFLRESVLADGSWPIDTNLATWITSLAVHALACDPEDDRSWATPALLSWILRCQHRERHPFTGASPGGWGWTDLSGAVPDGDDTPAAILALAHLSSENHSATRRPSTASSADESTVTRAAEQGLRWLFELQNRDGGWPTFCRGWGKLPFDRSSTDLTAHALRALHAARTRLGIAPSDGELRGVAVWKRAVRRGERFLRRRQQSDGSLMPLWFGNQDMPDEENPVYGTARALLATEAILGEAGNSPADSEKWLTSAASYLVRAQHPDGGWGGGVSRTHWLSPQTPASSVEVTSSVEETAVAVEGLAHFWLARATLLDKRAVVTRLGGQNGESAEFSGEAILDGGEDAALAAIIRGVEFLCEAVRRAHHHVPWPIGFYFAKLWYHERLYGTVFATAALGTALRVLAGEARRITSPSPS